VPFAVPNIPAFSFFSDGVAGAVRNVAPVQFGSISRIGSSIYATVPAGTESLYTAWGFTAGTAPPGTKNLAVNVSGLSMIYGNCYTVGGYARAYAEIYVAIDEFETLEPVDSGLADTPDSGVEELEDPTAVIGSIVFKKRFASNPTILLNHETSVLGYQIVALDDHPDITLLVMPVTPGNVYRWWIACYQFAQCVNAGWAGSNISFDFDPVFFDFAD
jgi:hypothetical protein